MAKTKEGKVKVGDMLNIKGVLIEVKAIDFQDVRADGSVDLIYYSVDGKMRAWDSRIDVGKIISKV